MRNTMLLIAALAIGLAISLLSAESAYAQCDAGAGGGNDTIVCNGTNTGVDAQAGDDLITNNGTIAGGTDRVEGGPGNDTMTNNEYITDEFRGGDDDDTMTNKGFIGDAFDGGNGNDNMTNEGYVGEWFTGGNGDDTMTNNGTVAQRFSGSRGDDTMTNNGTVEEVFEGGNHDDNVTNNGLVEGDFSGGFGGNDTVTNNGIVLGDVIGDSGDDNVTVLVTSTVVGNIDGGPDTDALTFNGSTPDAAGWGALDALANTCAPNCAGVVTFCNSTFTFLNFEALTNAVTLVAGDCPVIEVSFSGGGAGGGSAPTLTEICATAVKVFRLPNGDLEVYSGFDILVPNGFLVAKIPHDKQQVGNIFSNASAPAEGQGWTATLEFIDGLQKIVVRDAAGNIINNQCQW